MGASLFAGVELAPRDPIMGLTDAFNHDERSHKVNLGVGVYLNDAGKIPVLRAVAEINACAGTQFCPEWVAAFNTAIKINSRMKTLD